MDLVEADLITESTGTGRELAVDPAMRELAIPAMLASNCLLIGNEVFVDDALRRLSGTLWSPLAVMTATRPLELPLPSTVATLVLRDVSELSRPDQERLTRWIEAAAGCVRIIATASVSPWPQVQSGLFLDSLYYRLNTITVSAA